MGVFYRTCINILIPLPKALVFWSVTYDYPFSARCTHFRQVYPFSAATSFRKPFVDHISAMEYMEFDFSTSNGCRDLTQ